LKVKICGITNVNDARLSTELGADMLGFIFYPKSKRYISAVTCKTIIDEIRGEVKTVGVFVNESHEVINNIIKLTNIEIVQLHGNESAAEIKNIDAEIIKSFRVSDDFNFSLIDDFRNYQILLDSSDVNNYGGTGKSFNWNLIPTELRNKIILAGGVSSKNIEFVYKSISPFGVDLSSSLEILPGQKDPNKLRDFFSIIKILKEENADNNES
jgi:phosphoribosylanthranilate isomerase